MFILVASALAFTGLLTSVEAGLFNNGNLPHLQLAFDETPCTDGLIDNLEVTSCTASQIKNKIQAVFETVEGQCDWDFNYEMRLMTRTLSGDKVNIVLEALCEASLATAFQQAPRKDWTDIDSNFTQSFLDHYIAGGTFLNTETGNFRNRDGSDPTDPANNKFYPSDTASVEAGANIEAFYQDGATSTILNGITDLETCQNQAAMCCFGRDRQYGDGNGNCARKTCNNATPADNSNICYEATDPPVSRHDDEIIHCHGLVWSNDTNDPSYHLRFNNFFYIAMRDHMYTRGYVEAASGSMCGCVEEMNPVVRADCSEVQMLLSYNVSYTHNNGAMNSGLSIDPAPLDFKFRACRGVTYDEVEQEWIREDNDLASKIYQLNFDDHLSNTTRDELFKVLVGYDSPNDNVNEEACEAAWDSLGTGTPYDPDDVRRSRVLRGLS